MSNSECGEIDVEVDRVRKSRGTSAELKLQLANLRSTLPDIAIFVFEGDDDKAVYSQWIRRIREEMKYEIFVCGGKKQIRNMKIILSRDLGGLKNNVHFFVDRDYDDLEAFPNNENVYMTDQYSIENYLVSESVLEEILKVEFPFNGKPELRFAILKLFHNSYGDFLRETKEVNRRIFYARRLGIELPDRIPVRVGHLAKITFSSCEPSGRSSTELIPFDMDTNEQVISALNDIFDKLDGAKRYRGKFAMLFFKRWLEILVSEYNTNSTGLFSEISSEMRPRSNEFTLGNFASKSSIPPEFHDLIATF
ncbi:DUF4435 domain-containing protein [Azospirillum sp. HJ39]|uniref:DUF4435 domain-containing protein n=1 Tax=Azospirillum sp. HJ39 TaxID=3159496 RepID=UPI0035575363